MLTSLLPSIVALIRLLWFLAAVACLIARLYIRPRLARELRDPDIRTYYQSLLGAIALDGCVVLVSLVPIVVGTPLPPILSLVLIVLLTAGYLLASITSLRLIMYQLRPVDHEPPKEDV